MPDTKQIVFDHGTDIELPSIVGKANNIEVQLPDHREFSRDDVFLVSRSGDFTCVVAMLRRGSHQIIAYRDNDGHSLLHWAAFFGDVDACHQLIECDADVNAIANNSQTPLMWACLRGHVACVNMLVARGADLCARDSLGANCLLLAVQNAHLLVILLLLKLQPTLIHEVDAKGCGVRF